MWIKILLFPVLSQLLVVSRLDMWPRSLSGWTPAKQQQADIMSADVCLWRRTFLQINSLITCSHRMSNIHKESNNVTLANSSKNSSNWWKSSGYAQQLTSVTVIGQRRASVTHRLISASSWVDGCGGSALRRRVVMKRSIRFLDNFRLMLFLFTGLAAGDWQDLRKIYRKWNFCC